MEIIVALIIARFFVNGAVDITSMVTGNQPPSASHRKARGENAEDGPLTRMIKAWYADAIEDVDDRLKAKRRHTKETKKRTREERAAEKEAERQRLEEARRQRQAERQRWIDEMNQREEQERRQEEKDRRAEPWEWLDEPLPVEEDDRRGKPRDKTEEPESRSEGRREELPPVEEAAREAAEPEEAADPAEDVTEIFDVEIVEEEQAKGPLGPDIPDLKVIPGSREPDEEWTTYGKPQLYAVPNQEAGGTTMTSQQVTPVEGGISTHIAWTSAMAAHQVQAATHVELVGASMFKGDNGPERLAKIARIQEMHRQLREAYLEVNQILADDKRLIGDAYAATGNQAGSKNYVID